MSNALSTSREIDFAKGYGLLVREFTVDPKPRPKIDTTSLPIMLPISEIKVANSVLQPRLGDGSRGESEAHVVTLAEAIRNSKTHTLDPILVWWSGRCWRVVDGHHRLDAYKQVMNPEKHGVKKQPILIDRIPVEVFDGGIEDVIKESTARNVKDKLRMSKVDKMNRAWKFTVLGKMTIPEIARLTHVSERTISTMRKVHEGLTVVEPGDFGPRDDTLAMTWEQARKKSMKQQDVVDEEWIAKVADDYARRLGRVFGTKLSKNPQLTLMALELYSEKLPARLVEVFREEAGLIKDDTE